MARIALRHVEKRYDDVVALADCSLEIADHEFVVLVGPSGSGKTTLLRIIAGLESISAGELLFDDVRMNDVDVAERDIAMVFQNYGLYPHMSVYDNMAFGLRRRKLAAGDIDRRVRRAAGLLNIEALLARRPKQLSGGQRQRVALGRAIVRDPAVFLLDEPLSNLDAHLRVQLRAEILRVHRTVTATAVYVTHDQVEALTMGDRIVVMHEGRIQQVGTPAEVYDAPVNRFVASFIGTPPMGFVQGRVEASANGLMLVAGPSRARLSPSQSALVRERGLDEAIIGIRPESARLLVGRTDGVDGVDGVDGTDSVDRADGVDGSDGVDRVDGVDVTLDGIVEAVELLGAEQYVYVRLDGGSMVARVPKRQPIDIEQPIRLGARAADLHLFDPRNGAALR